MIDLHNADLVFEQIENPISMWCDCGHKAPPMYKNGTTGTEVATRFFKVKHKDGDGIFCEVCLIIANHFASLRKKSLLKR